MRSGDLKRMQRRRLFYHIAGHHLRNRRHDYGTDSIRALQTNRRSASCHSHVSWKQLSAGAIRGCPLAPAEWNKACSFAPTADFARLETPCEIVISTVSVAAMCVCRTSLRSKRSHRTSPLDFGVESWGASMNFHLWFQFQSGLHSTRSESSIPATNQAFLWPAFTTLNTMKVKALDDNSPPIFLGIARANWRNNRIATSSTKPATHDERWQTTDKRRAASDVRIHQTQKCYACSFYVYFFCLTEEISLVILG